MSPLPVIKPPSTEKAQGPAASIYLNLPHLTPFAYLNLAITAEDCCQLDCRHVLDRTPTTPDTCNSRANQAPRGRKTGLQLVETDTELSFDPSQTYLSRRCWEWASWQLPEVNTESCHYVRGGLLRAEGQSSFDHHHQYQQQHLHPPQAARLTIPTHTLITIELQHLHKVRLLAVQLVRLASKFPLATDATSRPPRLAVFITIAINAIANDTSIWF